MRWEEIICDTCYETQINLILNLMYWLKLFRTSKGLNEPRDAKDVGEGQGAAGSHRELPRDPSDGPGHLQAPDDGQLVSKPGPGTGTKTPTGAQVAQRGSGSRTS